MSLSAAVSSVIEGWHMDESSDGSTAVPRVGFFNARNLSAARDSTLYPKSGSGKFSNCVAFASDVNSLFHADDANFSFGNNDCVLGCWVNPTTIADTGVIAGKVDFNVSCEYGLVILSSGKVRFYFDSSFDNVESTTVLSTGTWYNVVGVYNKAAGKIRIYVNGVKETEAASTGTSDGTLEFRVGRDASTGSSRNFAGSVDELFLVKDFSWTDSESTELYAAGAGVTFENWTGGGGGVAAPISVIRSKARVRAAFY